MGTTGGPGTGGPGRMTFHNLWLRGLIVRSYNVRIFQISGPPWIDNDRFDIVAVVPGSRDEGGHRRNAPEFADRPFQTEIEAPFTSW